jgi:hypothetical protein
LKNGAKRSALFEEKRKKPVLQKYVREPHSWESPKPENWIRCNLDPARSRIGKSGPGVRSTDGNWVDFYREFSSVAGLVAADFAPNMFKVLLQPQMEKYRCLWYKSSSNHNILYFQYIHS